MGLVWGLGAMWGQVSARGPWGAVEVLKGGLPRPWGRGTLGNRPLSCICFAGKPVWSAPLPFPPRLSPPGVGGEEDGAGVQQLGWAKTGPWLETRCGGAGFPAEPSWAERACVGVCGSTVCMSMHECEQVSE